MIRAHPFNPQQGIAGVACRKTISEAVKNPGAPDRPGRMACVFACPTAQEPRLFMAPGLVFAITYRHD